MPQEIGIGDKRWPPDKHDITFHKHQRGWETDAIVPTGWKQFMVLKMTNVDPDSLIKGVSVPPTAIF
jgi:hypothetical protein